MWGISIIIDEYIYWGIVLLNGITLLTQICHNGDKNHLQTRTTADGVGICSQVRRYFSLFMRHISQVRRFDQPRWDWQVWQVWQKSMNPGIQCAIIRCISQHTCAHIECQKHRNPDDLMKWKHFLCYWPLCGEFTDHRWIPLTKASDAELWCFPWTAPEQTVEQTMETPVIWDVIALITTSP